MLGLGVAVVRPGAAQGDQVAGNIDAPGAAAENVMDFQRVPAMTKAELTAMVGLVADALQQRPVDDFHGLILVIRRPFDSSAVAEEPQDANGCPTLFLLGLLEYPVHSRQGLDVRWR